MCYSIAVMRIANSAILLMLLQTALAVPGKTADQPIRNSTSMQTNVRRARNTPGRPTVRKEKGAKSNEEDTQSPADANGPEHVIVDNLPQIGTNKDGWNETKIVVIAALIIGIIFTGVLIIGGIALVAIFYQAKEAALAAKAAASAASKTQSDILKHQSTETDETSLVESQEIVLIPDNVQRQLRAYVCLDSGAVIFPEPAVPVARIRFKNSGQTPAYDVRGSILTWFAEYPLKEALPDGPEDTRKTLEMLAPGRASTLVASRKAPLPPQCLSALGTPEFMLYVYGTIRYRDIFGKEQFTNYRVIHGGGESVRSTGERNGIERWLLKPDAEGNDAS